jgi:hypothetical protein
VAANCAPKLPIGEPKIELMPMMQAFTATKLKSRNGSRFNLILTHLEG